MVNLFKPILILFIMLTCSYVRAEIGMGDWQCVTPQGNTIDNYSSNGNSLFLKGEHFKTVDSLKRWYFYKDFIVGEREYGFFIANEKTDEVHLFETQNLWEKELADSKLKPHYTRWFNSQWVYYDDIGYYLLMFFFISAPCILIFLCLLYIAVRYEKFHPLKPCTMIILTGLVLVLITYLLERFPQSV